MSASRAERFGAMQTETAAGPRRSPLTEHPVLPCEAHWIDLELYDDDGRPMAHQEYVLRRADGSALRAGVAVIRGRLDEHGAAREVGLEGTGECVVEFPGIPDAGEAVVMPGEFWADVEQTDADPDGPAGHGAEQAG